MENTEAEKGHLVFMVNGYPARHIFYELHKEKDQPSQHFMMAQMILPPIPTERIGTHPARADTGSSGGGGCLTIGARARKKKKKIDHAHKTLATPHVINMRVRLSDLDLKFS